ncbi:MAG: hypothetical protein U0031_19435 [Thermomicrobiales bacterium]
MTSSPSPIMHGMLAEFGIAVILLAGIALIWSWLVGDPRERTGLLRKEATMLSRMEGFRRLVLGLVSVGIVLSVSWDAKWLLWLALGIGFVEILESSTLIAIWKRYPGSR